MQILTAVLMTTKDHSQQLEVKMEGVSCCTHGLEVQRGGHRLHPPELQVLCGGRQTLLSQPQPWSRKPNCEKMHNTACHGRTLSREGQTAGTLCEGARHGAARGPHRPGQEMAKVQAHGIDQAASLAPQPRQRFALQNCSKSGFGPTH